MDSPLADGLSTPSARWRRRLACSGAVLALAAFVWLGTETSEPDVGAPDSGASGDASLSGAGTEPRAWADISNSSISAERPNSEEPGVEESADVDPRLRQIVGEWEDDYQGHRHLAFREDGTATMTVRPSGIGSKLFASRLRFDIEWTFSDDRITMTTLGGEPESKVKLITNLYGAQAIYQVLNLDDKQFLWLDADGKTKYDWRRLTGTAAEAKP